MRLRILVVMLLLAPLLGCGQRSESNAPPKNGASNSSSTYRIANGGSSAGASPNESTPSPSSNEVGSTGTSRPTLEAAESLPALEPESAVQAASPVLESMSLLPGGIGIPTWENFRWDEDETTGVPVAPPPAHESRDPVTTSPVSPLIESPPSKTASANGNPLRRWMPGTERSSRVPLTGSQLSLIHI